MDPHHIKGLTPTVHTKRWKIKVPGFAFTDTQQLHVKSGNRDGARCPHSSLSSREWHVEEVFTPMSVVIQFNLKILNTRSGKHNQNSVTTKGRSNATLWTTDAAKTGQEEDAKHTLQFNTATCELMRGTFCPHSAHKKIFFWLVFQVIMVQRDWNHYFPSSNIHRNMEIFYNRA